MEPPDIALSWNHQILLYHCLYNFQSFSLITVTCEALYKLLVMVRIETVSNGALHK